MSIKKNLLGVILAGAAISGANAQGTSPDIVETTTGRAAAACGDSRQTWSATNGFIGCTDALPIGAPEVVVVPRVTVSEIAGGEIQKSHRSSLPFRSTVAVEASSIFGTGAKATFQGGSEKIQAGVSLLKQPNATRVTTAIGTEVANGLIVTAGASYASENAAKALGNPEYAGILKASQGFVRLDIAPLGMDMRMAITAIVGSSKNIELRTTSTSELLVRTEDLPTVLRTIEETWKTTSHTSFQGSSWKKVLADASFNIGSNGALTIRLGRSSITSGNEHTNHIIGGATLTQYQFLGGSGKLSVAGDTLGGFNPVYTANAKYEWPLNNEFSAYVGVAHIHPGIGKNDTIPVIGLSMSLDGNNTARFRRPDIGKVRYTAGQAVSTVLENTGIYGIGSVAGTGKVVTKIDAPVLTNAKTTNVAKVLAVPTGVSMVINGNNSVSLIFALPTASTGQCRIDGGSWTACASPWTTPILAVGTHTLEVQATNGVLTSSPELRNVTITPLITPLTPANETASTAFNTAIAINLLANNSTPNAGGVLTLVGTPTVTNGTLTVSGSTVTVTPTAGFVGNMVVTYVVGDGKAANIAETATIMVNAPANTAPSAIIFTPSTLAAGALTVGQSAGSLTCTDLESATCTYSLTSQSTAGAFAVSGTGVITIANAGILAGTHSITVVATDAGGLTQSEVKNITINPEVITLPSCDVTTSVLGFEGTGLWPVGAIVNLNMTNCTPGSTWVITDITSGGPVLDWRSPTSGSGDGIATSQIQSGREGTTTVLQIIFTKGSHSQTYILTAPPIV